MSMYLRSARYLRIPYYLNSLLRHVRWNPSRLSDYQNHKVHEMVDYAFRHVGFYHEKYKQLGINPNSVKTVDDLKRLPIMRRRELQKQNGKAVSNEFDTRNLRIVSTSGSTGQPLFTYITEKEDAFRKAKLLRANMICGQKPRDKWVSITGPQHESSVSQLQRSLGFFSPVSVSVFEKISNQLSQIEKIKPGIIDGYSNSIFLIAKEIERLETKTVKPRLIIGGAELTDDLTRRFIEKQFDAPFYDQYGAVEFERLAWQCEEKNEYHMDADTVIMEFVDENGQTVAPGERGEIVCTSLFNYAMPFIRYAIGDVGTASIGGTCSCGRSFPLMKMIEGRADSLIILPEGRIISPLAFGWMMEFFRFYSSIYQYRIIQQKNSLFKFLIEMKDTTLDQKVVETELLNHMQRMLKFSNDEIQFNIDFVDKIPLEKSGKLRKVIREL